MISRTLRLYPTREQEARLVEWFQIGTGVWNWALSRYVNAGPVNPSAFSLAKATAGHAKRIGFSSNAMTEIIRDVSRAWFDYRSGLRGKPRWKGARNRLSSVPFSNDKRANNLRLREAKGLRLPVIGEIRCRGTRGLPDAQIAVARVHRRPRGWYATITLDAEPEAITLVGHGAVGVDLGYSTLATLSNAEKVAHPNEYRRLERRLAQAQRSRSKKRPGRIMQSIALARRTRNHRISRDLVSRFSAIYVSKDNVKAFQRRWGKSVLDAGHYQLREMLASKCRQAGRVYLEVSNVNSTRSCSSCGALTGPSGLPGLSVRVWTCACGATHDRDINAAVNTLRLGAVLAHETAREGRSEISGHC